MFKKVIENIENQWDKYLFILIVLVGYFQISFFIFPLKFGAIYFHFPWRYDIVESIRNGFLPLWNFTQHMGFPIHADPQSGAWYPIVWLFSLLGKYDLYSFHMEFMLHIFIAGLGMQFLAKELGISRFSGFFISIAYVFSGIFSDNVLTSWTISMAWMPVVMAAVIRLKNFPIIKNVISLSLAITMLITGGYPAFTISFAYIILVYVLVDFIKVYAKNKQKAILNFKMNFYALVFIFLMTFVLWTSLYFSLDFMGRTHPISLEYASDGCLNFKSFITLILPFAAIGSSNNIIPGLDTYFTMANSYFGILPLILFISAFFIVKKKNIIILASLGIIFLLFSLGPKFYIYDLFYYVLPGFNLSRYPNFIRAIFIIIFLIISGIGLDKILKTNNIKIIIRFIKYFILLFTAIIFYEIFSNGVQFQYSSFYDFFRNISLDNRLFLQSVFQLILLLLFWFFISKNRIIFKKAILVFLIVDMVISFQINFIYTGYAPRISLKSANTIIKENAAPITFDKNQNILKNYEENKRYYFDYGLNDYAGKVNYFGNTSFKTYGFGKLINEYPHMAKNIFSNPILYFSHEIEDIKYLKNSDKIDNSKTLFLNKSDFHKYSSKLDDKNIKARLLSSYFSKNRIDCEYDIYTNGFVTLLQNYYYGWKVFVDGIEEPIEVSNFTFISVFVKEGHHKISFIYDNIPVRRAFYISSFSFSLLFLVWIYLVFIIKGKDDESE